MQYRKQAWYDRSNLFQQMVCSNRPRLCGCVCNSAAKQWKMLQCICFWPKLDFQFQRQRIIVRLYFRCDAICISIILQFCIVVLRCFCSGSFVRLFFEPIWRMQNARVELLPCCFMSDRENLTKELPTSLNLILTVLFRIACYC